MSVFQERRMRCPSCGEGKVAAVIVSLNGGRTPHVVDEIRQGRFQRQICDRCQTAFVAEGPLMYTDFDSRRWVGAFPRMWEGSWRVLEHQASDSHHRAMVEHAPPLVREMAAGFAIRTVFGLPALAEKILCWDAGFDDRALELLKLELYVREGGPQLEPRRPPRLIRVTDVDLDFACDGLLPDGDALAVSIQDLRTIEDDLELRSEVYELLASGPYVDIGRFFIDGDEDPNWDDVRAAAPFGQLSWRP
jgi:hypothetical protein